MRYLNWYLPSLSLQFALGVMSAALRGTGIVKPTMIVQVLSVMLNALLAPVLIAGWGTGHPLGVAGAGLANSVAVALGVMLLAFYFHGRKMLWGSMPRRGARASQPGAGCCA